jgi:hypothetical protein
MIYSISDNMRPLLGVTVKPAAQRTVAGVGTPQALGSALEIAGVYIRALLSNSGTIFLGDSTVSSSAGFPLTSSDDPLFYPASNLDEVYVDVDTAGEGVVYWPV